LYSLSDDKQRRTNLRNFHRCSRRMSERLAMSDEARFDLGGKINRQQIILNSFARDL
jgi:hypothetical protein